MYHWLHCHCFLLNIIGSASCFCISQVRSLISDFSVFTSILAMVAVDYVVGLDTPKLLVPEEFRVCSFLCLWHEILKSRLMECFILSYCFKMNLLACNNLFVDMYTATHIHGIQQRRHTAYTYLYVHAHVCTHTHTHTHTFTTRYMKFHTLSILK